ncbi:extracellular catalytic domain type 1 short-chain-length polyhydroxyalkanoate depolymerase [Saccharomonospora saliphila]|uniref:extracellular catalytic domain type 1 short-chain-length polyhydroxyalkanoate depolymerase n=1 Tax=Saccharomonospora saliphila TaxID=369829 RepID=UPI00037ED2DC|nr:PHB depolymerase family esterase [Saccharomonospora saliphila]
MFTTTARRKRARTVLALLGAALLGMGTPVATAQSSGITEVSYFGSNPGNLRMHQYVPAGLPDNRPVVVAMHGCSQNGPDYGTNSGWVETADQHDFALVLPGQRSSNNYNGCFNWFSSADTTRGWGEVASVRSMVGHILSTTNADPSRVYVTGLSAGGAMTAAMLATYPDTFAAGGIVAGIPYRCATTTYEAYGCMNPGEDRTPSEWGDLVRSATTHTGPWPTVSVWHGDADYTVAVANQRELVEQWTNVHGTDATADSTGTVAGYPHATYTDQSGRAVVETVTVTGMGHGQPIDPGTGPQQCGHTASYQLDVDVCAAAHLSGSWGLS